MATKIMRFAKVLLILPVFTLLYGCASILNPYESNFACPIVEEGKCVSIPTAYKESLADISLEEKKPKKEQDGEFFFIEGAYRDALFTKLTQLLRDPKSPVLAPPKIVRIMILPYQNEDNREFYSARYVYTIVDDPKWLFQNLKSLPLEEESQ